MSNVFVITNKRLQELKLSAKRCSMAFHHATKDCTPEERMAVAFMLQNYLGAELRNTVHIDMSAAISSFVHSLCDADRKIEGN